MFTRNGIGMLSSVLRSETAVEVNIRIMRAFTAIPDIVNNNVLMMQRILNIEQHQTETDEKVNQIITTLRDYFARVKMFMDLLTTDTESITKV